jgi:ActR/RegA family two-component response regulator
MEADDIGFALVRAVLKLKPRPAVVIYTGYGNPSNARTAIVMSFFLPAPLCDDRFSRFSRLRGYRSPNA